MSVTPRVNVIVEYLLEGEAEEPSAALPPILGNDLEMGVLQAPLLRELIVCHKASRTLLVADSGFFVCVYPYISLRVQTRPSLRLQMTLTDKPPFPNTDFRNLRRQRAAAVVHQVAGHLRPLRHSALLPPRRQPPDGPPPVPARVGVGVRSDRDVPRRLGADGPREGGLP